MKVTVCWITSCTVDLGELSLRENWALIGPRAVQSSSSISSKDIIRNRNITWAMISPCLTPNLRSIYVSILPMISLNTLLSYMRLITEHSIGRAPYFPSMAMSSVWLEVLKNFTRSVNANHVRRLWLCLRCRSVLIVNMPYLNPTPGVDPNWNFMPSLLILLNNRSHMILL